MYVDLPGLRGSSGAGLGVGIVDFDLNKVFEPFHRGANVTAIKGTGLGLPIVKRAAETIGATIVVKSQLVEGTQFTVRLNINKP